MLGTLRLGTIPSLTAWQGEDLTFYVTSNLTNKWGFTPAFSLSATPKPAGKLTVSYTGYFQYQPALTDREEITVTVRAEMVHDQDRPKRPLKSRTHDSWLEDLNCLNR
jgi:hypothetical protein